MNLFAFTQALTARLNAYKERMGYTYFDNYSVLVNEKQKYFKVYKQENKDNQVKNQSIVCFINKETGDIYKPATFNTPAKHARGNVLSPQNGMEAFTLEGNVIYLK